MSFFLICILEVLFLIFVFIWIFYNREKKHKFEIEKEEIYEEICGFRIANFSATVPFAKLRMYKNFFVLSSIIKIIIEYEKIVSIERKKMLLHSLIINLNQEISSPLLFGNCRKIILYPSNINKVFEVIISSSKIKYNN